MTRVWEDITLEQLPQVAEEFTSIVKPGIPIMVDAEMASGKTTFAKYLVQALGGEFDQVSSPTFSLLQHYDLNGGKAFYHVDLYRLKEPEEIYDLDLESCINENSYLYVEWPEYFLDVFDIQVMHLAIQKTGSTRRITIKW